MTPLFRFAVILLATHMAHGAGLINDAPLISLSIVAVLGLGVEVRRER